MSERAMHKDKGESRKPFNNQPKLYESANHEKYVRSLYAPVLRLLEQIDFDSLLDVGCATGELLSLLLQHKAVSASGIDVSEERISIAREQLGMGVDLFVSLPEKVPCESNRFDAILCAGSFHYFPNPTKVLRELWRVIKHRGHLVIADVWVPSPVRQFLNLFRRLNPDGPSRIYSKDEITDLLGRRGFYIETWEYLERRGYLMSALAIK